MFPRQTKSTEIGRGDGEVGLASPFDTVAEVSPAVMVAIVEKSGLWML